MPHIQAVQAQIVLANPGNYPEVIVSNARAIAQWHEQKRQSIQWLWTHRSLLHTWRKARVGTTFHQRSRSATRAIAPTLSQEELNTFHRSCGYLRKTATNMGMQFAVFDALLKTLQCNNLALMHEYFACCNAQRHASNLDPVGFLRWVNGKEANEILVWRMLNNQALTNIVPALQ